MRGSTSQLYIGGIIIISYFLEVLCVAQLAYLNLHDVPFIMAISLTMVLQRKSPLWWLLLAATPIFLNTFCYLLGYLPTSSWLWCVPELLILLGMCWLLLKYKASPQSRFMVAIFIASLLHISELYMLNHQPSPVYICSILLGTLMIIFLESRRYRREQALQRRMHTLVVESERDGLTGLLNYRAFNQEIGSLSQSKRIHSIVIGAMDIDHFKHINDTYGHLNGNDVLSEFSETIKTRIHKTFPQHGYIYRFGGEEFTIVVSNHSIDEVKDLMCQMEDYFHEHIITTRDKDHVQISFSCSLTLHRDGEQLDTTLKRADRLLYHVKNNGRGWVISDSGKTAEQFNQ